jgi:simple sugar transport system permease protein
MKGLIIVCTVLVQEQNLGQLLAGWRRSASSLPPAPAGSAEKTRPRSVMTAAREDINETS